MNKDYFIQMLPSEIVFSVIDLLSFIVVIVAHKMNEMEGDVMYKKGDYVIKIPEGMCKIEDIGYLDISHPVLPESPHFSSHPTDRNVVESSI